MSAIDFASRAREISVEALVEQAFQTEGELAEATRPAIVSHLALRLRRTRNAIALLRSLEVQEDAGVEVLTDEDLEIIG